MKKLLLSLFCCMLMALSIYAETKTYTYDFSSNTYWVTSKGGSTNVSTGTSNKLNAFYYKDSGDEFNAGGAGYFNDDGYFLWGKSGKYIQLPTFEGEKITNVTATCNPKGSPSTKVKVGIYNEDNVVVSAVQWATKGAEYSYDIPEEYQSSVLRLQVTSAHNCQTVKIVITTETSESGDPTLIDPEISWSESSVTTTTSATDFVAPTLTNANNLAVTYSSSDEAVATVDATGTVTIVGAGTTTIKATWEATETYKGGSASYTLNVLNAVATLTEFINAAPTTNTIITGAVTVYYQSSDKRYTFITDDTSNFLVYSSSGLANEYKNGDQLTGIAGTVSEYGGIPQMIPDASTFGTATEGTAVQPKIATLADDLAIRDYVTLTGVSISGISGSSFTITDADGNTFAGYNRFAIELTEIENATVTGIVYEYNSSTQLYIISVEGGDVVLELGAIMYQDFALDQNHICGAFVGTPVVFSAENAESIKYTVGETLEEASSSSITWTPTEVGSFNATVTATLGEETKTVNFTINVSEGSAPVDPDVITDALVLSNFGVSGTSYQDAEYISSNGVTYTARMAGGNSAIQLRTKNSDSGVVVSQNKYGLVAKAATITWNSNTKERILNFYGNTTAYTAPSELYATDTGNQGIELGSASMSTTPVTVNFIEEYPYIGFRSKTDPLYLDKVEIEWAAAAPVVMIGESEVETKVEIKGETVVTFRCNEYAKVYYLYTEDAVAVAEGEDPQYQVVPAEGITVSTSGTLSYYAEIEDLNNLKSVTNTIQFANNATAITEIEAADNEAAQWYDLNGRRVAAPGKGIYILRQGNKATKHVF